jgi:hypothetical protein
VSGVVGGREAGVVVYLSPPSEWMFRLLDIFVEGELSDFLKNVGGGRCVENFYCVLTVELLCGSGISLYSLLFWVLLWHFALSVSLLDYCLIMFVAPH